MKLIMGKLLGSVGLFGLFPRLMSRKSFKSTSSIHVRQIRYSAQTCRRWNEVNTLDELWADDLLGRRAEAELLEEVLVMEAGEFERLGREQAFVLAVDAAYGEGKTFFLTKLRQHLAKKHPVAFVDAWADDTSDEPLLAIMSAINEALEPYLKSGAKTRS